MTKRGNDESSRYSFGSSPAMTESRMIRLLPPVLVSRIAAGEVIERPASVVKELVENAVDAGARNITIHVSAAGTRRICVDDDGHGMGPEDLALSVQRHATSKINGDDLENLSYLGFRGEALPAIGSISCLKITSRRSLDENGWMITVDGGDVSEPVPVSAPVGTRVEMLDLFYATPARLKFLKTPYNEMRHIVDRVERLAMVHHHVSFILKSENHLWIDVAKPPSTLFEACLAQGEDPDAAAWHARLIQMMGDNVAENTFTLNVERDGYRLFGLAGLPTYNRAAVDKQYVFVNQRPVRDKFWPSLLRIAYKDVLPHDRNPVAALFLTVPPSDVDVNVHPAKAEVRFRDAAKVRGFVISALRNSMAKAVGKQVAPERTQAALNAFRATERVEKSADERSQASVLNFSPSTRSYQPNLRSTASSSRPRDTMSLGFAQNVMPNLLNTSHEATIHDSGLSAVATPAPKTQPEAPTEDFLKRHPLGYACAQLHTTYIVTQTQDGMILVDQHAAHERITYEKLKKQLTDGTLERQPLLVPEVIELSPSLQGIVLEASDVLAQAGLIVESFGTRAILVREKPMLLAKVNLEELVTTIAHDLETEEGGEHIQSLLLQRYASMACHSSIRAGQTLSIPEMNALLRAMETTEFSAQCNHGRPTYIKLTLSQIESLFGRH